MSSAPTFATPLSSMVGAARTSHVSGKEKPVLRRWSATTPSRTGRTPPPCLMPPYARQVPCGASLTTRGALSVVESSSRTASWTSPSTPGTWPAPSTQMTRCTNGWCGGACRHACSGTTPVAKLPRATCLGRSLRTPDCSVVCFAHQAARHRDPSRMDRQDRRGLGHSGGPDIGPKTAGTPAETGFPAGGRYWFRTSGLCRVEARTQPARTPRFRRLPWSAARSE